MLIKKEIKADKWKIIIGSGILLILSVTIIWQYPLVKNLLQQGVLEGMPKWIVNKAEAQTEFSFYLASNWYDKNLIQITIILSILLGMSSFAREIEDHTIEFLLARPLSRKELFLRKTGLHFCILLSLIFICTLIMGITGLILNYEIYMMRLLIGIIPVLTKCYIFYCLTLLVSLFLDDQVKSALVSLLIIVVMLGSSFIESLQFINLFSYGRVGPYYVQGVFPGKDLVGLVILGGLLYLISFNRFLKRDF